MAKCNYIMHRAVVSYFHVKFNPDKSIWVSLKERFLRPNSGNISDVYDGVQYKKWEHFLNEQAHVSLLLNTDGVAIFRSSKFSIWPVWIVINELPKSQRYTKNSICIHLKMKVLHVCTKKTCYLLVYGIARTNPL